MNNLKLFLLVSICFLLSCNDEDFSEKILGIWEVEAYRILCPDDPTFFNIPWTDASQTECISNDEFEMFLCLTGLQINSIEDIELFGIDNGVVESGNLEFLVLENERIYSCLNEGDNLEECDFLFFEDDQLIYQYSPLFVENCIEQYRFIQK